MVPTIKTFWYPSLFLLNIVALISDIGHAHSNSYLHGAMYT